MKKILLPLVCTLGLLAMSCSQDYNQDYSRTTPPPKAYQRGNERLLNAPSPQPIERKVEKETSSPSSPYDLHLEKPTRIAR